MALTDRDLQEVGRYVQAHLFEWLPEPLLQLNERAVRVEEELRSQRELMIRGFEQVDKRFEETRADMNTRFETLTQQMDKRFEALTHLMDTRFEDSKERFGDMSRRFSSLTRLISTGFVVLATLMSLYAFFL